MLDILFESLRLYCERKTDGIFAEPLGSLSNLAFIIVGIWATRQARTQPDLRLLGILAVIVGLGSGLFHSLPNLLTQAGDVVPIAAFCIAFLWRYHEQLKAEGMESKRVSVAFLIAYSLPLALTFASGLERHLSQGAFYVGISPTLFIAAFLDRKEKRARCLYLSAFIFLLAFTARSLDRPLCSDFSQGTHFLWHLLNALLMFVLFKALQAGSGKASQSQ